VYDITTKENASILHTKSLKTRNSEVGSVVLRSASFEE